MFERYLRITSSLAVVTAAALGAVTALAAEPIRIGAPLLLSGHGAFVGGAAKNTLEMVAEQVNGAGGIGGRKLEFIYYDTEGKPDVAVRLVKRLIEDDKVTAIVGISSSWEAMAVLPILEKAQIPTIIPASTDQIVEPVRPWVFKTPAGDRIVVAKLLEDIKAKGISRVALLSTQDAYGNGGRDQVLKQAPGLGITVVFDDRYTMEDTDITPMLGRVKKTDAQAVINWSSNRAPVIMTMNYRQLGIELPLYHGHNTLSDGFLKAVGDKADGILIPSTKFQAAEALQPADPQRQVIQSYRDAYRQKYGSDANQFGSVTYDAISIMLAALRQAGTDRAALRNAIERTRGHVATGGVFTYSPTDHGGIGLESVVMYRAEGGQWKLAR